MSLGVVDAVAETPAACESFHIPFQSGSTEVLKEMGRGHTREKYLHIVDRIRTVRGQLKEVVHFAPRLNSHVAVHLAHSRCSNYGRCNRRVSGRDRGSVSGNSKFDGGGEV